MSELLERERIRDALQRYARGVDRRDWALVASAYHSDGYDDHGGYKGGVPGLLEWLERRHATIEQSMHFLGNCIIDFLSEGIAVAETYCMVYQRYGEEARETIQVWLGEQPLPPGERLMAELACRYVDRFELREGEWRIARRTVVMEEVKASVELVRLRPGYAQARRDRTDALWQALGS
ncbi:nuclear transport factor 2 family protein [Variovorax sp. WS11]|uniref:nuclear transport factor 2 family protein n=1 Tax=Variovorax sp. WS11 TaxID=1105204 RepID=UPI0013DA99B7|nr:nuclear transport factor 2 family protein [Variovorax sp. WS11]